MQQKFINFETGMFNTEITHLKDKSYYDHNYYHIGHYGDWLYGKLDTILQIYSECENCYEYQYGYFNDKDEFIPMLYWNTDENIFDLEEE